MKEIVGAVVFGVLLIGRGPLLKKTYIAIRNAALEKAVEGLPPLEKMNHSFKNKNQGRDR